MDLRIFHPKDNSNRSYKTMDRFNSWTSYSACRFLERMGWYRTSIPTLLLGHYRFFQLHRRQQSIPVDNPTLVNDYILQRQAEFNTKGTLSIPTLLFYTFWSYPLPKMKVNHIDQRLQNQQAPVLHEFLINADSDFEKALHRAIEYINTPAFLAISVVSDIPPSNLFLQIKTDHHTNNYNQNSYSHNELNIHPVIKEEVPAKEEGMAKDRPVPPNDAFRGKQKDVFSKKQVLIFFDLLTKSGKIERLDLKLPNKHESISQLLHGLTGKSKETWLEELQNYRSKDLYAFHDSRELDNLLNTLKNLSAILRAAGQRTLSDQVDKKIKDLKPEKK